LNHGAEWAMLGDSSEFCFAKRTVQKVFVFAFFQLFLRPAFFECLFAVSEAAFSLCGWAGTSRFFECLFAFFQFFLRLAFF
jgi:hypothetical protein